MMSMFLTILAITLLLVAIALFLAAGNSSSSRKKGQPTPTNLRLGGLLAGTLALVCAAGATVFMVPTQQIGIPVTFGKPGVAVANGIHVKAPWTHVVMMDGTVQNDDNTGDARTEIRLGNQSVAYVQNMVRWRIRTDAADRLYRDHRKFENIEPSLEQPEVASALNDAFANYNPLATVTGDAPTLDQLAAKVKARLTERIGDRIVIESVIIPKVDFDNQTQARIDAYQSEIGNTRIAEQRKKTAAAEAEANKVLAGSVSNNANVLVSKCLDQLAEMVNKGQQVPAGFSCWPGGGSTVIAQAATASTAPAKK